MQFTDAVTVAGTRRRDDGYLVADARIARTGIQTYHGSEVGKPNMAAVRVYRPGSEVFSEDTLKSAAHRPVTNDHPEEHVTSKNWKDYAVGQTGDEVTGEGIFIRVPLMVSDEADAAIRKAAVVAKLGDEAVKDKTEAYIDARFDILAEDAKKIADPFRTVVQNGIQTADGATNSNDASAAMLARDAAAWQGQKESA
jgi:hypothetical protein